VLFVLRELSSVFVAWFVVYLLLLITAVYRGSDSYRQFLDWAGNPLLPKGLLTLLYRKTVVTCRFR
jgi:fumarate reductase subunit C